MVVLFVAAAYFANKNTRLTSREHLLVDHLENKWHQVIEELHRWRGILASEWNLYKSGRGALFAGDTTSPYTAPYIGLDV